jgi:hypothetical protein
MVTWPFSLPDASTVTFKIEVYNFRESVLSLQLPVASSLKGVAM